jgi:MFS family permease
MPRVAQIQQRRLRPPPDRWLSSQHQIINGGRPHLLVGWTCPLPDQPGTSQDRATQLALGLYVAYKLAATVASVLAGRLGDRRGDVLIQAPSGSGCSGWPMLASPPAHQRPGPGPWFVAAGVAIGCVGTAEHAAVAALAPVELRGSAFGLLAAVQSFGTSPPAPSPACSGPPHPRGRPSPTSWPGCCWHLPAYWRRVALDKLAVHRS